MKPLPSSRTPASSRRSPGGEGEGGDQDGGVGVGGKGAAGSLLNSSRRGGGGGGGGGSVWCDGGESRASSNLTWMRKLEDRYQRLHRKIASIPTCNTPASRFNFLTRRFVNETLAKAQRKQVAGGEKDSSNTTTTNNNNIPASKIPSTAPSTLTYKDSLQVEDLLPPPRSELDPDDDANDISSASSDSDNPKNDENLPPVGTATTTTTAPGVRSGEQGEEKKKQELLSQYYPQTVFSRHHSQPSTSSLPHAAPTSPFITQRRWRSGSVGSVVEATAMVPPPQHSPLLERDESLEGNANMAAGLTQAGHSAPHVTRRSPPAARAGQPLDGALARSSKLPGVNGGQCEGQLVRGGDQQLTDSGDDDDDATKAWLDQHMGDLTASGIRTLKPISAAAAGRKRGSMLRATHTHSQYSYTTTKSCPAILTSSTLPSTGRRHSGSRRPTEPRERGTRHAMRVLPQMSMEARHAITETLKEMGALRPKQPPLKPDEHEDDPDEKTQTDSAHPYKRPSLSKPASALPPQAQQQQHQQHQRSKSHLRTSTQTNGENSSSHPTSYKTLPRQKSFGALRPTDATSSVNATVRGGRSPRKTHRKTRSVHTSVNLRTSCKSAKTLENWPDNGSQDVDKYLDSFDRLSMASAGNLSSDRSSPEVRHGLPLRTQFPAITSGTEPDVTGEASSSNNQHHVQHVSYKLRGIGSYRVPRERTFEITDADFDIRYRDVITCQKGDRDTPPPDIFEKSVGKVREWLTRYFYHT